MSYYIYKICCDDCPEFVYVGSTKAFRERKKQHKTTCNNENNKNYNTKLYTTIRENGGWDNFRMVLIEECGEISFTQARIREEEWRVKLNGNLNMKKCHITEEERKEYEKELNKKYRENNADKMKQKNKEFREENPDKIKKYNNKYYSQNKDKILEHLSQKMTCECGRTFRIDGKAKHEKSLTHKELIEEINNINII